MTIGVIGMDVKIHYMEQLVNQVCKPAQRWELMVYWIYVFIEFYAFIEVMWTE